MTEDRMNELIFLYINKDISLDFESIITAFANRNPRKMLLINPLV